MDSRAHPHFGSIDLLRGFAALAVGFFHLTTAFLQPGNPLRFIFERGHLGVECFFVISGFIIPYTLWRKNHHLRDAGRFLLARVLRLHPAYLASLALMLLTLWLPNHLPPPWFKAATIDWSNIALHLLYLSEICGKPWINGVYWSLAIEMQYYLLLAFAFPLLHRGPKWLVFSAVALFAASGSWAPHPLVFHHAGLFTPGILLFLAHTGRIQTWELLLATAASITLLALQSGSLHRPAAVLAAFLIIRHLRWNPPAGAFLGRISYSFYLVHTIVGFAILNLFIPLISSELFRSTAVLLAIAAAILAGTLFHHLVEAPTHRLAQRIGQNRPPR